MNTNNEDTLKDVEEGRDSIEESKKEPADDGEFKVTVRKLEVPARPRGVLAE
jgi:hypothetical protein